MTIVADCGSTKTAWVDVATGQRVDTEGLNPHFTTDAAFCTAFDAVRQRFATAEGPTAVHFYGAGCGQPEQQRRVALLLEQCFGTADVHVATDMLAACRATSSGRTSVVAILGTGSNLCLYDGHHIACQPTSTGYILGDRGSANHVGRLLLDDYLAHRMPLEQRQRFSDTFGLTDSQLLDAVYHQPNPNRFLGRLASMATGRQDDDYCTNLIVKAIDEWRRLDLDPLLAANTERLAQWDGALQFVGGFAKAVEGLLQRYFATQSSYTVASVARTPIEGLLLYHKNC